MTGLGQRSRVVCFVCTRPELCPPDEQQRCQLDAVLKTMNDTRGPPMSRLLETHAHSKYAGRHNSWPHRGPSNRQPAAAARRPQRCKFLDRRP